MALTVFCPLPEHSVFFSRRMGRCACPQHRGCDGADDNECHAGPTGPRNVVTEQGQAVKSREHNARVLTVGHHQRAAMIFRHRIGPGHAHLPQRGKQHQRQQPHRVQPVPVRQACDLHAERPCHCGAHRKVKHGLRFRLAHARNRHDLHVGKGSAQA